MIPAFVLIGIAVPCRDSVQFQSRYFIAFQSECVLCADTSSRSAQFERVIDGNDPRLDLSDIITTTITMADIVRHSDMSELENS